MALRDVAGMVTLGVLAALEKYSNLKVDILY